MRSVHGVKRRLGLHHRFLRQPQRGHRLLSPRIMLGSRAAKGDHYRGAIRALGLAAWRTPAHCRVMLSPHRPSADVSSTLGTTSDATRNW